MIESNSLPCAPPITPALAGERLRIALAITDLDVGGAERAMAELAVGLDPAQFEVRVWGLMPPAEDEARSLVPMLRGAGIPVATLDARGLRDAPRTIERLNAAWRAWPPHVVQTFLFHANILGRLAACRAHVPHVVSGIRVAERRGRWRLRAERWTDFLVDCHVCVSRAVAEFSQTAGGLPPAKLLVIPNGIDAEKYAAARPATPAELSLPAGRRWITYVGRLDAQKGLEWLLAQPAWLEAVPAHDLLLVGDGPLAARLADMIRIRRLEDRVRLLGWRADVPAILAASDLLVLPSEWEGMPNVVLEAMAAGRPVLASDVEGVRELLGENAQPQVFAVGDRRDLTEKLARLIDDAQLAQLLGSRNRSRAGQYFSRTAAHAAYAELYRSLASNPAPGGDDLA